MTRETPEHGARFEILRESLTADGAIFAIAVIDAAATHQARVIISVGAVQTHWSTEPPRWIADTTNGFVKTLQKNHAADASWPARLVRWRAERE
jgi:hypothetical protein